jgi:hypothetical protein
VVGFPSVAFVTLWLILSLLLLKTQIVVEYILTFETWIVLAIQEVRENQAENKIS